MTKADEVRKQLTDSYVKNGPSSNCKEAYATFVAAGNEMHYSQFNTIFRKFCSSNDIEIVKASKEPSEENLPYEEKELYGSTFRMKCWKNLDVSQMVTEESIGKTVQAAGEEIVYKVKKYHHKGDPMWPVADGVTVENEKYGRRMMYLECLKISS